jgi:hypothetical protein
MPFRQTARPSTRKSMATKAPKLEPQAQKPLHPRAQEHAAAQRELHKLCTDETPIQGTKFAGTMYGAFVREYLRQTTGRLPSLEGAEVGYVRWAMQKCSLTGTLKKIVDTTTRAAALHAREATLSVGLPTEAEADEFFLRQSTASEGLWTEALDDHALHAVMTAPGTGLHELLSLRDASRALRRRLLAMLGWERLLFDHAVARTLTIKPDGAYLHEGSDYHDTVRKASRTIQRALPLPPVFVDALKAQFFGARHVRREQTLSTVRLAREGYFRAVADAVDGLGEAANALGRAKNVFRNASDSVLYTRSPDWWGVDAVGAVEATLAAAFAEVMARGASEAEATSALRARIVAVKGDPDVLAIPAHAEQLSAIEWKAPL